MKIKYFMFFILIFGFGFSQIHVVKYNNTYLIYTYYYTVSFDPYLDNGLNIDNKYNLKFFSNIEELEKRIFIKEGQYSKLIIPIKTNKGKYYLEFKENYFILSGKKTNKYINEEIKINFDKVKKVISTKNYIVLSDINFLNSLNLAFIFPNKVNKTELTISKGRYIIRFKPLEYFSIKIHPFYSGKKIYGDLLLNEKFFDLPKTSLKTNDISKFAENNLDDIKGEYYFKNKNIFKLLYLKKVCINSGLRCRIFICKNAMGIDYYDGDKWTTIYLEGTNKKDPIYIEPLSYFLYLKEGTINEFIKQLDYLKLLGKKDLRPFFVVLVVLIFLIGYSVMCAFDKYIVKYKSPIKKFNYDGRYRSKVCLTEKESEIVREILNYIEKNNGYFTLKEASYKLNMSEEILKTILDYMLDKNYIEKVDDDGRN